MRVEETGRFEGRVKSYQKAKEGLASTRVEADASQLRREAGDEDIDVKGGIYARRPVRQLLVHTTTRT